MPRSPSRAVTSSSVTEVLTDLRTRLLLLREQALLNQTALAKAAGWHPSKVSKIESGRQTPSDAHTR